ncbi:MAG: DNA polymerase IV [Conexivisphaerales archaeon]
MLEKNQTRIVIAIDMDYFYAQCEELRNPEAKGKPVIVGMFSGRTEISGAVATANYEARKYGVKSGIPLARAKKLLEGVDHLFVHPDFPYYESVSSRIMAIIRSYSKRFAQESIDEAFIDITDTVDSDYKRAGELAKEIKERIRKETGIKCSIGVGPNKLIAKMACDSSKPDGLMIITPEHVEEFLKQKDVDSLYGIGPRTAERLKAMGIHTVGELAALSLEKLRREFGNRLGLYFYQASRGIDETQIEEKEREQLGRMLTLKQDTRDINDIKEALSMMAKDITQELKSNNLSYKSTTVTIIDTELKHHSRSRTLRAKENDAETAANIALELVKGLLDDKPEIFARRLGLSVSYLSKEEGQQQLTSFFA